MKNRTESTTVEKLSWIKLTFERNKANVQLGFLRLRSPPSDTDTSEKVTADEESLLLSFLQSFSPSLLLSCSSSSSRPVFLPRHFSPPPPPPPCFQAAAAAADPGSGFSCVHRGCSAPCVLSSRSLRPSVNLTVVLKNQ